MNIAAGLEFALLAVVALLAGSWLGSRTAARASASLMAALGESKEEAERLRREREPLVAGRAAFEQQAEGLRRQNEEQREELISLRDERTELIAASARKEEQLNAGYAELASERARGEAALASERDLLTIMGKQLKEDFKLAANAVLTESNSQFLGMAKNEFSNRQEAIDTLLQPVKETLVKLDEQTRVLESKREGAYEKLGQQLLQLDLDQKGLQQAAIALSSALRDTRVTGKWGEIVLHRVVELAGMTEHCDYTQQHTQDDNRPDMIVRLPNGRKIIVDAKTSVGCFLEASEAQDETTRQQKLKEHARNIRAHALGLAKRRYEKSFEDAIDMTICFIPGDVYYYAALQIDPGLFEAAANEKIIFATPTTLIALLKAAAFGWQQDSSRREANEILKQAQEVYERLSTATGHLKSLGGCLNSSVESYDKLLGSLEGRVFPAARRMKDLGISGSALPSMEPIDRVTRQLQAQDWRTPDSSEPLSLAAAEERPEE